MRLKPLWFYFDIFILFVSFMELSSNLFLRTYFNFFFNSKSKLDTLDLNYLFFKN